MATFLFEYINQLEDRWHEVDVLLDKAKDIRDSEQELYNAICRSITVLIVAHFEGYIKDIIKYVIKDINFSVEFKDLSESIKRTYCTKYLGLNIEKKDKQYERKINKLIEKFSEENCRISHEPFFYSKNKNPKPDVVRNVFARFGISNVFHCLHESKFDDVFSSSLSEIKTLSESLKPKLLLGIEHFPYQFEGAEYELNKTKCEVKPLWEEFLEQINQKRHGIAHGNEFENVEDVSSLELKKSKVVLLELILTGIISSKITPSPQEQVG